MPPQPTGICDVLKQATLDETIRLHRDDHSKLSYGLAKPGAGDGG